MRRHLTFANVLSVIALFVALGGASYAAVTLPKDSVGPRQIKKGAVTTSKISRATRATLKGNRGPGGSIGATGATGPQGPAGIQGDPGTAKAFALISSSGTVSLSQGITNVNVSRIGTGSYCIFGLAFTPQNAIATIETIATGDTISTGIGAGATACPAGTQVRAFTFNGSNVLSDHSFFVLLN
jgi:hypothetical protein